MSPKFQASSHLLWLYSLVCVGPGRKHRRQVSRDKAQIILLLNNVLLCCANLFSIKTSGYVTFVQFLSCAILLCMATIHLCVQ